MARTDAPPGAQEWVPPHPRNIDELKSAATGCQGCELFADATQTVFGRGAEDARIVFVGEQPGDMEDQHGLPFVGPAGRLLREAVDEAGIDPAQLYITNAVKHFRFELRGRRRIHQTPGPAHITACRPWLVSEFALLKPKLVVMLGATAAKALLGPAFRVTRSRGQLLPWPASAQHPEDSRSARSRRSPRSTRPPCCVPTTARRRTAGWSTTSRWRPRSEYARTVRLTDFWGRLEESFGSSYARSIAADQAFSALGGRTIDEAIRQGVETATIWRAVVAAYPDRVPSRLR